MVIIHRVHNIINAEVIWVFHVYLLYAIVHLLVLERTGVQQLSDVLNGIFNLILNLNLSSQLYSI